MCDCYYHKCEHCRRMISMHIGDFSAHRDTVHVLCPECLKAWVVGRKTNPHLPVCEVITDADHVRLDGNDCPELVGSCVGIWCDDPHGRDIYLN